MTVEDPRIDDARKGPAWDDAGDTWATLQSRRRDG
jgi:hypothetical protein